MKSKPKDSVTLEFVQSVLDYDPATGLFRWRARDGYPRKWNSRHAGKPAGCIVRGYIQIRLTKSGCYPAHRLAWLVTYGQWPNGEIDHINGDPSDNRLCNLRDASHAQNSLNRRRQSNNTSGFIGVRFRAHHRKWEARINLHGKTVWRAYFETAQEAASARRDAVLKHHGSFARIS